MTEAIPADITLSELEQRWELSRNGVRNRAKALRIKTLHPTAKTSFWPGEYLELGDELDAWLKQGNDLKLFPYILQLDGKPAPRTEPSSEPELIDPTRELQALKSLARDGDWWSARELAILLGRPMASISKWKHGEEIRPDFFVDKRSLRGINWFKVTNPTTQPVLTEKAEALLSLAQAQPAEQPAARSFGFPEAKLPTFNCNY